MTSIARLPDELDQELASAKILPFRDPLGDLDRAASLETLLDKPVEAAEAIISEAATMSMTMRRRRIFDALRSTITAIKEARS